MIDWVKWKKIVKISAVGYRG